MANIQQYEGGNLQINPDETGINATAQAARRINGIYSEVAQAKGQTSEQFARNVGSSIRDAGNAAVDYMDHQQISHGAAAYAQQVSDLTDEWEKRVKGANPNDPAVAANFEKDVLNPALEEFRKGFTTEKSQAWAETRIDAFRNHMFERTRVDMAGLAKDAVTVNNRQIANQLSNTARTDPSALDFLIDTAKHSIEGQVNSSPNLKGLAAAQAKNQLTEATIESIVKSAAMGAIERAPDPDAAARDLAARYPKYINGSELQTLVSAARAQVRMRRLEDQSQTNQQHTQNIRAANDAANNNFVQNVEVQDDGTVRVKPGFFKGALDIAKMPDAPHGMAQQLVNWGQTNMRRKDIPVKDEPAAVSDLTQRIFDPENPTTRLDLMKANAAGNLSDSSFTKLDRLVKEVSGAPKDPPFKTAIAAAKQQLEVSIPGLPGRHPEGAARYAAFVQDFYETYAKAKKTGTLDHDALDLTNPNSMISKVVKAHDVPSAQKLSEFMSAVRDLAPVVVKSEAEANGLPAGTRFKLGDKTGTSTGSGAK